jgi:hypothetical protein
MFEAIILACLMSQPDMCITAEDARGPYQTEEECVMRVHQMVTAMQLTFPVPHTYRYKCREPEAKGVSL